MVYKILALFTALFICGYLLSAYLYHTRGKRFTGSELQVKVIVWIPIFLVFMLFVYGSMPVQLGIVLWVIAMMAREYLLRLKSSRHHIILSVYAAFAALAFLHILLFPQSGTDGIYLLLAIGFASVLSDVGAFFIGNFLGKHPLPEQFNPHKSWEGVAGQLVGALIGILLVRTVLLPEISLWLALPVGVGASIGDLYNSYAKRKEDVKDWGASIRGHGGYLDRFASLGGSLALTYYSIIFFSH